MAGSQVAFLALLGLGTLFSGLSAVYAWRRRLIPGSFAAGMILLACAVWLGGYFFELQSATVEGKVIWNGIQYLGIVVVPAAWFVFSLQYTRRNQWVTLRNLALLSVEPVLALILVFTNEQHGLFWDTQLPLTVETFSILSRSHSFGYWIHAIYSLALTIFSSLLLAQMLLRSRGHYRRQISMLLVASFLPIVGNAFMQIQWNAPFLDLTPLVVCASGLALVWGLFRLRVGDIIPVAHELVVKSMGDGIIVLDERDRVVDLNLVAERMTGRLASEVVGRQFERVWPDWGHLLARPDMSVDHVGELFMVQGGAMLTYDVHVSPVIDWLGHLIGRVLVLRDVSQRKVAEQVLQQRNQELALLHRAGQELTSTLDLDQVLDTVLEEVRKLLDVVACSVWLIDPETEDVVCQAVTGPHSETVRGWRVPAGQGIVGWVTSTGESAFIPDLRQDDRHFDGVDEETGLEIRSILGVPLQVKEKVIGVLEVVDASVNRFNPNDLALLEPLVATAAIAIENARLYQETDYLRAYNESIILGVSEGVLLHNPEGEIVFVNPALLKLLGYTADELVGQPWQMIVSTGYEQSVAQETAKRPGGIASRYESAIKSKDGRIVPVIVSARPLFEGERFTGVLGVFTNIAERVQAEAERTRLLSFLEASLNEVYVFDTERWLFEYVNVGALENLGYTMDEMRSMTPLDLKPEYSRDSFLQLVAPLKTGEKDKVVFETIHCRKDKSHYPVEVHLQLLQRDADQVFLAVILDISERLQAEEALRQAKVVIENSPTVLIRCQAKEGWPLTFVSDNVTQMGYNAETLVSTGVSYLSLVHPDDRARVLREAQAHIDQGDERFQQEYRIITQMGGTRSVDVRTTVEWDAAGQPIFFQGVVIDVTEQRELQKQLEQQERLAAVGQLAAGIAHDFNNIMASIILYSDIMMREPDRTVQDKERLETIHRQGRHAGELVQQILDFGRKSIMDRQILDLLDFMQEMERLLKRTLPENIHIRLKYRLGAYTIHGDPTRLQQVIMNLAVNARDAMPAGGDLFFELEQFQLGPDEPPPLHEMQPGAWLKLTVRDTGMGIPEDVLPRVFDPFFTTKDVGKGTGLGLSQVFGIVKQHDGCIKVDSLLGYGTTFFIYFPQLTIPEQKDSYLDSTIPAGGRGELIMVVEDDEVTRQALSHVLETLGYRVMTAANGREALVLFEQHQHETSLVVSDLVMPEIGGVAMFHALQRRFPGIKVLVITGYPPAGELDKLLAAGVVGWLQKPVDMQELSQAVSKALATRVK